MRAGFLGACAGRDVRGLRSQLIIGAPVDKVGLETTGRLWPAASFYVAPDILLSWYDNDARGYEGVRINHL